MVGGESDSRVVSWGLCNNLELDAAESEGGGEQTEYGLLPRSS